MNHNTWKTRLTLIADEQTFADFRERAEGARYKQYLTTGGLEYSP